MATYTHNASKTVWTVYTGNSIKDIKNCLDNSDLKGVTITMNEDTIYVGTQTHINLPDAIIIKKHADGIIKIKSKYGYMATLMTDYGPDGLPTTPYTILNAVMTEYKYPAVELTPLD